MYSVMSLLPILLLPPMWLYHYVVMYTPTPPQINGRARCCDVLRFPRPLPKTQHLPLRLREQTQSREPFTGADLPAPAALQCGGQGV